MFLCNLYGCCYFFVFFFFFQAEDGIRDHCVTGVQTCALPISEAAIAGIADLDQAVPVPRGVPWFPDDVDAWSVRWVLLHVITETARHAGHADIVREMVDGATAFPLMAAVEGWPATDWMQPWAPAAS